MTSRLSPYNKPTPIQSLLLKKTPDSIPPTNELESLHDELKQLRKLTQLRSKKAGDDLRAIEESMRRMKEKEKGKAKAVDKVKREREFTPTLDGDDNKSTARSSLDPRRSMTDDLKKKKKKRKRELEDSDVDRDQRPRKSTPPVIPPVQPPPPTKAQKSVASSSQPHPKPSAGPDFSLPPSHPLLPPRPPVPPPPLPGPSKPTEVTEDFSKTKQPAQVTVHTFYSSIEPWIRNIREEDVGFLEYTGDEVEPYVMPKLGRHYLDVWEDQDAGLVPAILAGGDPAPPETFRAPVPTWDPSTLGEGDLIVEEKGHGPLTERVISALLVPDQTVWKGVKAAEDAMEGRPGGSGAAAARKEKLNVGDLEARIRDTMRYHGLLDGVPEYSEKVDDPIATALRQAQRELRRVVAANKARKARLIAVARDRLGYQEYLELRDALDKNITNLFTKLQRKDNPKLNKKKKPLQPKLGSSNSLDLSSTSMDGVNGVNGVSVVPGPCPAAMGFTTDDEMRLGVHEQLMQLVETRRQWVDTVGGVFEEKQRDQAGRIWGMPTESIYEGVEAEVQAALNKSLLGEEQTTSRTTEHHGLVNGNGNGKTRSLENGDPMDVG